MKIRDSGMPDEVTWEHFFDAREILSRLNFSDPECHVVEFGCGYGTFTVTAATLTRGTIYALDIEPSMLQTTAAKAASLGLSNIRTIQRDFVQDGTGLPDNAVSYVMLFNILHAEEPLPLLREAHRVLRPGGSLGIIHWNCDPDTPRGPPINIRPEPKDCATWAESVGFQISERLIALPPYHYGILAKKGQGK